MGVSLSAANAGRIELVLAANDEQTRHGRSYDGPEAGAIRLGQSAMIAATISGSRLP